VHWGLAAEGTRVYVPNADTLFLPSDAERGEAKPGLFTLDAGTGETLWFTPVPNLCSEALKPACDPGISAAVTAIPGVVFAGGFDGWLRAFDGATGRIVWEYDTNREFDALFEIDGRGGSIESAGPVVVDGALLVNSGYLFGGRMPGNVLLKFSVRGAGGQT
jgi:polyvinyl alcohol dehydrogenase (cytochrome)